MKPTYRHGGNGRDPLGPRHMGATLANIMIGLLLLPIGVYAGVRHGGSTWLLVGIGALLIAVELATSYLDPVGGPRRHMRFRRPR